MPTVNAIGHRDSHAVFGNQRDSMMTPERAGDQDDPLLDARLGQERVPMSMGSTSKKAM